MKRDRSFKIIGIASVIVAILGLSLAFAALSRTLTINGTAKAEGSSWNIVWEEIDSSELEYSSGVGVVSGYPKLDNQTLLKNNTAELTGTNLDFDTITFHKPNDYVSLDINITNKGDIDANLIRIIVPDLTTMVVTGTQYHVSNYITISITDLSNNAFSLPRNLTAGSSIPVRIKISLNDITNEMFNAIPSDGIPLVLNDFTFELGQGSVTEETTDPNTFSWASVGLAGVDTSVDYKVIYDSIENSGYILNFTTDGKLEIRPIISGSVIENKTVLDAEDNTSINPFTMQFPGIGVVSLRVLESGYLMATLNEQRAQYVKMTENLGKKVTYQNMDWYVLYDDSYHGTQLLSAESYGNVVLGSNQSFNACKASYNNAIETLVNACKSETGITSNIRNVGGPSSDPTAANQTVVFEELSLFSPTVDISNFAQYSGFKIANMYVSGYDEYREDIFQMLTLGLLNTDTPSNYWLSMRRVWCGEYDVNFTVSESGNDSFESSNTMCLVNNDASNRYYEYSLPVRPVVTISSQTLESLLQ